MRFHIFSDLHVDHTRGWTPSLVDGADAVICAGDVCEGLTPAFRHIRQNIDRDVPIITVAGNHSFYGCNLFDEVQGGRWAADTLNVYFLENNVKFIGDVRFLGCTLWTDYKLYGNKEYAQARARHRMMDHELIRFGSGKPRNFMPTDAEDIHRVSRIFLERSLSLPHDGPTVVVTHHAPSINSVHEKYRDDVLNPAFVSNLDELILRYQPALWVHGHVHSSFDYRIGETRVVCNPHGYGKENPAFDPTFTVEV